LIDLSFTTFALSPIAGIEYYDISPSVSSNSNQKFNTEGFSLTFLFQPFISYSSVFIFDGS
jgi:hypothetical protein